ncbi:DUF1415 domain-containing protein [Thalassolituus sp.]|uniref:DUF1415 domain-containing protein n=1 Tax=Thalassolituus sp. TaxID=2030822 RepID=UPI00243E025C
MCPISGGSDIVTAGELTEEWVRRLVVGEGLCPFASPVMDALRIHVCGATDDNTVTAEFMTLLQQVAEASPSDLPTALFVVPNTYSDFDEYWNWTLICDDLLVQMGYEGLLQLATFHPRYEFEGEDESDMSHFTNRSPFPMLHIIREQDIEDALKQVRNPDRIPERNRQHMRRIGHNGLLAVMPALADTAVFAGRTNHTEASDN